MDPPKGGRSGNFRGYIFFLTHPTPGANLFFLTMLRQHSQYDSRLGFSFRVLVRVRLGLGLGLQLVLGLWLGFGLGFWVRVRVRVDFRIRVRVGVRIRVNLTLTLTKTLKINPNLLSYWECCRNMVRNFFFAPRGGGGGWGVNISKVREISRTAEKIDNKFFFYPPVAILGGGGSKIKSPRNVMNCREK